jgi:sortase (surface protein transpeptidase)
VRPAAATAVLGIALAVGVPTAWSLTRPPASVGAPVEQVLESPPAPRVGRDSDSAAPALPAAPRIPTRDAAPQAVPAIPAPARLTVPDLGVDAVVDPVGVEPDGQMTVPAEVDRVGWYRFGPPPGKPGSAVIAGHVDSRTQGLGAMAPLREAAPGQEVLVTDATGAETRWRVVSREVISKQVLPLDRLFTRDGPPRLTLITCGGPFLSEFQSYRDNVVVVAEPIP